MSIPIPDFTVRRVIREAIEDVLANRALLATEIFGELEPAERDEFLTALDVRKGKVRLGWGEEAPEDWCVTVALAGTEPLKTLGGVVSEDMPDPIALAELDDDISAAAEVTLTFVNGLPANLPARGMVRLGDEDTGEYAIYRLDAGACILEHRGILRTAPAAHDLGTPVMFFQHSQRRGYGEWLSMRVDVLGIGGDFVSILARVLQAYLINAAAAFNARGYALEDVRATDLAPRPAMFPANFSVRTVTLRFLTTLSLPETKPGVTRVTFTPTYEETEGVLHAAP